MIALSSRPKVAPIVIRSEPNLTPFDGGGAHRSATPVRAPQNRRKSARGQRELFERVDSDALAAAEAFAKEFPGQKITPEQAAEIARSNTLVGYWRDHVKTAKTTSRKRNTVSKYNSAVSCWAKYSPRPDSGPWSGMPIGLITTSYAQGFIDAAAQHVAAATLRPYWNHLVAIFRHAKRSGVIKKIPKPVLPVAMKRKPQILQVDQIAAGYAALAADIELQVSFVLSLNVGARPRDIFALQWSQIATEAGYWSVTFTATKTSLAQCVPLADVTVQQLQRLPGWSTRSGSLFPSLGNAAAKDPERSRPARRRRQKLKAALATVGIDIDKPYQVCRATCNTRLDAVRDGVGKVVLGHKAKDVNTEHYLNPDQKVREAVFNVPQPDCFSDFERA